MSCVIQKNNFNLLVVIGNPNGGISQQLIACATRDDVRIVKENILQLEATTDYKVDIINLFPT